MRRVARLLILAGVFLLGLPGISAEGDTPTGWSDEEVQLQIDRILSAPEYQRFLPEDSAKQGGSVLAKWLEDLLDSLLKESESSSIEVPVLQVPLLTATLYAFALGAVGVVAFFIIRGLLKRQGSEDVGSADRGGDNFLELTGPPGELAADVYVDRAAEAAARGDYKQAVRQLLLGAMSWTERRGLIRYRKGLTNRDYVRALWRHEERRRALAGIIHIFDLVYFGRRPATEGSYRDCLKHYEEGFADAETRVVAS